MAHGTCHAHVDEQEGIGVKVGGALKHILPGCRQLTCNKPPHATLGGGVEGGAGLGRGLGILRWGQLVWW